MTDAQLDAIVADASRRWRGEQVVELVARHRRLREVLTPFAEAWLALIDQAPKRIAEYNLWALARSGKRPVTITAADCKAAHDAMRPEEED